MTRRRRPICRRPFVVPVAPDPSSDVRPGRQIIEEALAGFLSIGREMIGAGVSALVDAAAAHGFDGPEWEADAIRPAIVEIIAPRLHAVLAEVMRADRRSDAAETDREVRPNAASGRLKNALADQLYAVIETEFRQYGLDPEPELVARLRECLRELVAGHWPGDVEPGAETDTELIPQTDRVQVASTIIPLLRYRASEHEPESTG